MLGYVGDLAAVEPLLALLDEPDEIIVESTCTALGQLGDFRALAPLVSLLLGERAVPMGLLDNGSPGSMVRLYAARALGNLGDPAAQEALLVALDDPSSFVCLHAVGALGKLHALAGADRLADVAQHDSDLWPRIHAARVLGEFGDSRALPTLIADNLTCGEVTMQCEACRLLGELGDPRAIPALIQARDTGDEQLHAAAIAALSAVGHTP